VRLAARLTGWDVDILTPDEFNAGLDVLEKALREVEGVDSTLVDQVVAMGMVNVLDVEEVGADPLVNELDMDAGLARRIVLRCAEEARKVAEEAQAKKAAEHLRSKSDQAQAAPVAQTGPAQSAEAQDEGAATEVAEMSQTSDPSAGGGEQSPAAGPVESEAIPAASDAPPAAAPQTPEPRESTKTTEAPESGEPTETVQTDEAPQRPADEPSAPPPGRPDTC
jgi:N utilization substance protein A